MAEVLDLQADDNDDTPPEEKLIIRSFMSQHVWCWQKQSNVSTICL